MLRAPLQARWKPYWDAMIICMVVYNTYQIPFIFAFDPKMHILMFLFDYLIDILFCIDIGINFRTGVHPFCFSTTAELNMGDFSLLYFSLSDLAQASPLLLPRLRGEGRARDGP